MGLFCSKITICFRGFLRFLSSPLCVRCINTSVQKVSCHVLWKIETFIEEHTSYKKHCTQDNDASVPFKASTLGPHTVLPAPAAQQCSFCPGSRSHGSNFATTHFIPRSSVKILGTVDFGIPRSASSSCIVSPRSLLIAACTHSTSSGDLLAAGLPEGGSHQQILNHLWSACAALLFALHSSHRPWKPSE